MERAHRLQAGHARDRLLKEVGQCRPGQCPDQNDQSRRHERDQHPAGHIAPLVVGELMEVGTEPLSHASSLRFAVFSGRKLSTGVRGTDAPAGSNPGPGNRTWRSGGWGSFVGDIATGLKNQSFGNNVYAVSLIYPATNNFTSSYTTSRDAGVAALTAELNAIWYSCSSARPQIYLAGYSQGSDVVALTVARIGSDVRSMIKGSVLMGDPGYWRTDAINVWSRPVDGIFSRPASDRSVLNNLQSLGWVYGASGVWAWRQQVRSYCVAKDAVCQANVAAGWGEHSTGYGSSASDAVGWMSNFILWG